MSRFRLTPRALSDLDEIAAHSLKAWGEAQTERYLASIMDRFQWLADNPLLGRSREEIGVGYRSFRQGSHIVFYVVEPDEIHIIGIPHMSRDVDKFFGE